MYTLMDSSLTSVPIPSRRLLGQKSLSGKQDAQGLKQTSYFPKATQRGILSPATTGLKKENGYMEKMTIDDSRSLTNLH